MASKFFVPRLNTTARVLPTLRASNRSFTSSSTQLQEAVAAVPVKKPVGAFRGSIFGFLLGSTLAGASVYYYILEEYKVSNQLLSEDIYALQSAVQRTHSYITELENKLAQQNKSK